jgi:hypothetical protein
MSKRKDIIEEWQNIVEKKTELPDNQPFLVPEGYFGTLTLRLVKPLLLGQQIIPESYFESFPEQVMSILDNVNVNAQVPEGYFEKLPSAILDKIKQDADDLHEIAPTLASISKTLPYTVPKNYFENTVSAKKIAQKPKVIVVPLYKKLQRYAVAASILCILSVSAYVFFNAKGGHNTGGEIAIDKTVPPNTQAVTQDNTIVPINTANEDIDLEKVFAQVDDKELLAFVDNHASSANFAEALSDNQQVLDEANKENANIEDVISNSSEAEINEYLSGGSL